MLSTLNPAITNEVLYRWRIVRDFKEGEIRVKNMGDVYLPKKSGSSNADYEAYKTRGKVGDYTNQALETFHGQIMRKRPVVDYPSESQLKKVLEDFDREGNSFFQFASDVVHDNLQTFFGGILVDLPVAENVKSVHDAEVKNIRPYARYYPAESIKDWRYRYVNGVLKLCVVKLEETVDTSVGLDLNHNFVKQYRILYLDEHDRYSVQVIREVAMTDKEGKPKLDKNGNPIKEEVMLFNTQPIILNKTIDYIPFEFIPYKTPESSLVYGIAELHKHYYLQSCDYENAVHMTTIPTGYVTGHTQEKDPNTGAPVPIYLGKDFFLVFSEPEAKVGVLQFSGEGIEHSENAIDQTLEQIGILGTRALSPDKSTGETSDAAKIHRTGENCKLSTYSKNISEIFTKILKIMASWLGIDGHISVTFNTDFDSIAFDPNALNAIANLAREGKYPLPLVFEALKKGEYLPNDMDFREFGMLVSLEGTGATIEEIIDAYQKMRSGEKFNIKSVPVAVLNKDRASNAKLPSETKQVSMELGK